MILKKGKTQKQKALEPHLVETHWKYLTFLHQRF